MTRHHRAWLRAAPAAAYLLLGALFAWNYRHLVTSDAVVYLDIASYVSRWSFPDAFIGYWGPLLPFLVAPLIAAGVAPLLAGKAVVFVIGLAWVLAFQHLLATHTSPERAALGTLVGAVPCAMTVGAVFSVLPDTLLSLVGIGLVLTLLRDAREPRGRLALLAGVLCGLAYFAKTPAWGLFVPPTLVSLAWTRWQRRGAAGLGPAALACLLVVVGLTAVTSPWVAGLSQRRGRFTVGSVPDVNLAFRYERAGYPHPALRKVVHADGARWTAHTQWAWETVGPVEIQWSYHVRQVGGNLRQLGIFVLLCPLAGLGLWVLLAGSRRLLRSPRRAVPWFFAAWIVPLLCTNRIEWRYLLYASPVLVLAAMGCPTPIGLRRLRGRRATILLVAALFAFGAVLRYWPRTPLGKARAEGAAHVASQLEGGERVAFNRLATGLPVAFLLDRHLSDVPPFDGRGRAPPNGPDIVVWSRTAAGVGELPDYAADYERVHAWTEEDGVSVIVLRRR